MLFGYPCYVGFKPVDLREYHIINISNELLEGLDDIADKLLGMLATALTLDDIEEEKV
jgi:hypothetical protein